MDSYLGLCDGFLAHCQFDLTLFLNYIISKINSVSTFLIRGDNNAIAMVHPLLRASKRFCAELKSHLAGAVEVIYNLRCQQVPPQRIK